MKSVKNKGSQNKNRRNNCHQPKSVSYEKNGLSGLKPRCLKAHKNKNAAVKNL